MDDDFSHRFDATLAGRHHARFIDEGVVYHVLSRTFQGRCLLQPSEALNAIVIGVIARALALCPNLQLYAFVLMSNHLHAMLRGPSDETVRFIAYIKREISRRWGGEIVWPGTMWDEYLATALPTPQSQIDCLKYILSQGVKEGLVERPEEWPGVHCAAALMTGAPMVGTWFDATGYGRAVDATSRTQKPKVIERVSYTTTVEFSFHALPAWSHLEPAAQQAEVVRLVEIVTSEARKERSREGQSVMGAAVVQQVPLSHVSALAPPPWFEKRRRRMLYWADIRDPLTQAYVARYWEFQHAFRQAADRFNGGDLSAMFPVRAFRPSSYRSVTDVASQTQAA